MWRARMGEWTRDLNIGQKRTDRLELSCALIHLQRNDVISGTQGIDVVSLNQNEICLLSSFNICLLTLQETLHWRIKHNVIKADAIQGM